MHRIFAPAPLLLLLACTVSPVDAPTMIDSALAPRIVGGAPSSASDDAVIMLSEGGQFSCTGTLVAPNLVLTARHCVTEMDDSGPCGTFTSNHPASGIRVAVGARANPRTTVAKGKQLFHESNTSGCSYDIALILLDQDVPGAALAKVRLTPASAGDKVSTVGYGDNGRGQLTSGRYRKDGIFADAIGAANYMFKSKRGESIPVSVPAGEILTGESTCYGDSGGPLFDSASEIIGVTSRGIDDSCVDRPSIYSDIATHATLIRTAFAAAGHPLAPEAPPAKPESTAPAPTSPPPAGSAKPPAKAPPEAFEPTPAPQAAGCQSAPGSSTPPELAVAILVGIAFLSRRRRSVLDLSASRPPRSGPCSDLT